jgi:hypothetical protein
LELFRAKAIEVSEETALLFAKAAGRSGCPAQGLATLGNPNMRVGLWSNASAWNYLLARLDGEEVGAGEEAEGAAVGSAASGSSAAAAAAYEAMQAVGVTPDGHTYHLLARAHLAGGNAESAARVVAAADACGLLLSATQAMLDAAPTAAPSAAEAAASLAALNPEVFEDESGVEAMAARTARRAAGFKK